MGFLELDVNEELVERVIKGLLTRRQKRALIRYFTKYNRCNLIIYAAYQNGGMLREAFFKHSDDTAFMIWGKVPDLDIRTFDANAAYQFIIEPSILKLLIYYNDYYEKCYYKNIIQKYKSQS